MPPPRGKSCAACTKAKRRCDFALPACLRCSARGIECQYPQRTRSSLLRMTRPAESSGFPPAPVTSPAQSTPASLVQATYPGEFFSAGMLMDEILAADSDTDRHYGKDIENPFPGAEFRWNTGDREVTAEVFSQDHRDPDGILMGDALNENERAVEPVVGLPTSRLSQQDLPAIVAERLRYGAVYLDSIPKMLVETLGTPWCHSQVFKRDIPKDLKDAVACSALYAAKSPENQFFVMKTLISNLSELSKSPIPPTHKEALARTHALGMYHIMALFDGDIEARAAAEADLPQLELACESLLSHITYDDLHDTTTKELPLFPLANTEAFWRTWILQESTRRTWFFTNQLSLMYSFLTNRKTVASSTAHCRSWCLSGSLWNAANAVDFAVAWGSGRRLVARMDKLDEVFAEARAGDLDEFGRMILTCYMGEQEARGWMSVKGESC